MFEFTDRSISWRGAGEVVQVDAWGQDAVRVRSTLSNTIVDADWALLPSSAGHVRIEIDGAVARLINGRITVVLTAFASEDWQTGYNDLGVNLAFYDADGKLLLREIGRGGALKLRSRQYRPLIGSTAYALTASFDAPVHEKLVGMGMYQQAVLDLKGSTLELAHRNSQASVPFVISDHGYGFLWHNPAIGKAVFGRNRTEWTAESSQQLDYWVTAAGSPREIARSYADATGHVPMMPERGLGLWQSKLRYASQEELLSVAREHARRDIPVDVIVADFFHWPKMGDTRFEDEFWPDPAGMVRELESLGMELMVSVWPQVSLESENYAALHQNNQLARAERGLDIQMMFGGPSAFLDVTNPEAREALWGLVRLNYSTHGIRTFWLDEAEPEYGAYDYDNYRYHAGPAVQVGNIYPQLFSRAFFDGASEDGEREIVNLVRAAWAGSQRYGALVWSGDIGTTFGDLARQITAGIHLGVAGIPWFTTDIGGFHGGDARDPAFVELMIRWFQFGTFSPVTRMHGNRGPGVDVVAADGSARLASGSPNEIWSYGDDAYGILREHLRLRGRLRGYVRGLMREAHEDGQPVIRGLFHEFPDTPASWEVTDQYLFGGDLLVAPITELGAREREVYFPAGTNWTDLRDGAVYEGGITTVVAAPIESIPVFAREAAVGSVFPLTGDKTGRYLI